MENKKNKKVSDIDKILKAKSNSNLGVSKDEKPQTDVQVKTDSTTVLNLSGYDDFFKKNEDIEIFTTIRVDKNKYDILKRLSIVHKLPVQVIFDNIVRHWLNSYSEQIQRDLKKLSKI